MLPSACTHARRSPRIHRHARTYTHTHARTRVKGLHKAFNLLLPSPLAACRVNLMASTSYGSVHGAVLHTLARGVCTTTFCACMHTWQHAPQVSGPAPLPSSLMLCCPDRWATRTAPWAQP